MTSHRSLRRQTRVCYFEPEEPNLDEYVFCEKCGDFVYEYCALHGALLVIPDDKVPAKSPFPPCVPRAALTVPRVFLHLNYSTIPGAGLGVFTTLALPCGVRFGPYRGERTRDVTSDYSWQIYDRDRKPSHVVDASDANKSNWMRYVNCARHWSEQNLCAFQYQGELYYRTIKIIPKFTELMVFYGSEYANHLEINLGKYNSPKSYAQKFGAPAPKRPKFAVKTKKTQQETLVKPLEKNKETDKLQQTNQTTEPTTNAQNTSGNRTTTKKLELQFRNEAPAPKKRKTEAKNTKQRKAKSSKLTQLKATEQREEKLEKKNKKQSKVTKPISQKGITTNKNNNIIHLNFTNNCTEEITFNKNSDENYKNIDAPKPVNDNSVIIKNNIGNENSTSNHEQTKVSHTSNEQHNVRHIDIKDAYFICEVCHYQGITKEKLQKHMIVHDTNRKFVCGHCKYRFPTNVQLNNHKLQLHGIKPTTIDIHECNMCDYKTMLKGCLKLHLISHTKEKPYSCDICDYKFSQAGNLKTHLRTHTGEKPYTCDICDYKCSHAGTLKTHLRIHTGQKPFTCDICDYKCSQAGHLKIHLRTHTREKPYSCDICDLKCLHAGNLKTHLRTHTGEKPYSCDICDYKSSYRNSLSKHLLNKHLK